VAPVCARAQQFCQTLLFVRANTDIAKALGIAAVSVDRVLERVIDRTIAATTPGECT
jgi:hypothetical protein